jgi:acetyl esterase/lipase
MNGKNCDLFLPTLGWLIVVAAGMAVANAGDLPGRTVPSRNLPVPRSVSAKLQEQIAEPPTSAPAFPKTREEWKTLQDTGPAEDVSRVIHQLATQFGVTIASQTINGVHCFIVTPKQINARNRNRILLGLHAGGWVFSPGESGLHEPIVVAGLTGIRVVAVDYRLLPQYPFPAALDDAMNVWKEVTKWTAPHNIGLFGSSVGGNMTLSLVQRAKREGLPLPGAVLASSPYSDLSKTGDTYYSNDGVDREIRYDGFWESVTRLYAGGMDLKDPRLSPVYGDFTGFPPTALVTGTRDLYLSNTVRVHQRLLKANVPTELYVEEGESHMGFLGAILEGAPEGKELYSHLARFFDSHLGG